MFKIIFLSFSLVLVQQVVAEDKLTIIKFKELFDPHIEDYSFESTERIILETLNMYKRDPSKLSNEDADELSSLIEASRYSFENCIPMLENEYAELMKSYKGFPAIYSYMSECELRHKNICDSRRTFANDWIADHHIEYREKGEPVGPEKTLEKLKKLLELYKDRSDKDSELRREKIGKLVGLSQFDPENCVPELAFERREIYKDNSIYLVNILPYMKHWLDIENEQCSHLVFSESDLESIEILDNEIANIAETDKKAARKIKVKAIFAHLMWKARAELDPDIKYKSILKKYNYATYRFEYNYRFDDYDDDDEAEFKKHRKCAPKFHDFEKFVDVCKHKIKAKEKTSNENGSNSPYKPFIGEKACLVILEDLEAISKDVHNAIRKRKRYCRFNPRRIFSQALQV